MNWYKYIKAQYEDNDTFVGYDQWDEEDDMEDYENQAWELAKNSDIYILSNKELARVAVADGKLLGALWTAWDPEGAFSFDIIVDTDYRRMGVGSNLVDQAMQIFDWESDAYQNPHYELDVVNDDMVRILKKKGFVPVRNVKGHVIMTMPETKNELV